MQTATLKNSSLSHPSDVSPGKRSVIAWFIILLALGSAGFLGEQAQNRWDLSLSVRYVLQALIMSGIVLSGIGWMRTRVDKGKPAGIGVGTVPSALKFLGLGLGLFLGPFLLTLALTAVFGWADISLNTVEGFLQNFMLGVLTVFLFEALPEELVFRGYIFSTLNVRFRKWKAALISIFSFVLLPVVLVQIQRYILGMEVSVGRTDHIELSYLITMLLFASFIQYLRILTGSIWTGIGFHLVFVYINRMIGTEDYNLIQLSNISSEQPMQIVLICSLLLVFLFVILYPVLTKKKLGWREKWSA